MLVWKIWEKRKKTLNCRNKMTDAAFYLHLLWQHIWQLLLIRFFVVTVITSRWYFVTRWIVWLTRRSSNPTTQFIESEIFAFYPKEKQDFNLNHFDFLCFIIKHSVCIGKKNRAFHCFVKLSPNTRLDANFILIAARKKN